MCSLYHSRTLCTILNIISIDLIKFTQNIVMDMKKYKYCYKENIHVYTVYMISQ